MIFRNMRLTPLFLFFFLSSQLLAGPVEIKGVLPGAENCEIRLLKFADRISFRTEMLDRVIISDSATFSLNCDIDQTIMVIIDIDYYSAILYVVPGAEYFLECEPVDIAGQYRPYYKKDRIIYKLPDEPEPFVNKQIDTFENRYADFVEKEMSGLYHKRNLSFLTEFESELDVLLENEKSEFVKSFIRYRMADLKFILAPAKRIQFFKEYIDKQPVLYENPEYMAFFSSFFDNYLLQDSKFVSRRDLQFTINNLGNYAALVDTLGKDTLLRNEVVRELVLLHTIKQFYLDQSFNQSNLISILDQMIDRTKFEIHRKIAANLRKELTTLTPGSYAPYFELPSLDGDTLSITDFRDKPIYLSFFTTWSYACLAEFELMDSLYHQFGSQIDFITISLDKSTEVVDRFRNEKNYEWTFLFNGSGYDLIHDYRIKTFPFFILIAPDGRIADYPAYKPSEIIADRFRAVLKNKDQ